MENATTDKKTNDKGTSLKSLIKSVTPEGVDPRVYYELVNTQIMGVDRAGKTRPIEDMLYFLSVAKKLQLDPVLKQIYPVYRWDSRAGKEKMVIQTGIDGFRLIAQRTGQYGGSDDPVYTVEDSFNPTNGDTVKQFKATVTVKKIVEGVSYYVAASARWNEYAQKGKDKAGKEYYTGLWASMPYNQLGKCAEALALRKAFPQDLSGLYISEEFGGEATPTKGLDLPTPKSIEEKKAKKAEGQVTPNEDGKTVNVGEISKDSAEKEATSEDKQQELLQNFQGGAK
jgi:phage recombination protein Bet